MMTCWFFRWKAGPNLSHAATLRRHPHLERCGSCQAWLKEQSSLVARLRASAKDARIAPPPTLAGRLAFLRVPHGEQQPMEGRGLWPWTLVGSGGVALALLLWLPRYPAPPPPTLSSVLNDLQPWISTLPGMAAQLEDPLRTELQNLQADASRAVAALARDFLPLNP
jgi:hypothetical protein